VVQSGCVMAVAGWQVGIVKVGEDLLEALEGWGRSTECSDSPEEGYDTPLPAGARTVVVGVVGGVGRRVVVVVVVNTLVALAEAGHMDIVEEAPRNHGLLDTLMEQKRKHSYVPSAWLR
jgi:hypothetical protein